MTPKISISGFLRFDGSYPEPTFVKYDLKVYKTDEKGRIEGVATFDLESQRLAHVKVYRYDDSGNRFLEMDVVDGVAKDWRLFYYSKRNYLICEQHLEISEEEGLGIGLECNYFYNGKGERIGRESCRELGPLGLTRTLHEYTPAEPHPSGKLYKDFRIISGKRDDVPNEYFVLDARGNQVEYGEVKGDHLVKRDQALFDSHGIELEATDLSGDGKIQSIRNNQVYSSLSGMEHFSNYVHEFDSIWEAVKTIKYPKSHYSQTVKRLLNCEQRFGLRQPFANLGHETYFSDMQLFSDIGKLAEQAEDADHGGILLAQIEVHLKILEPRLYYRLTRFTDDIVAELYLRIAMVAVESGNFLKMIRYGEQSREFNQMKNEKVEAYACMNIVAAAMDLYNVTNEVQLLKDAHPAYVTFKQLQENGKVPDLPPILVIRFARLYNSKVLDQEKAKKQAPTEKKQPLINKPVQKEPEPVVPQPPQESWLSGRIWAILLSSVISIFLLVILIRSINSNTDKRKEDEFRRKAIMDSLYNDSIMQVQAAVDAE